MEDNKEKKTVNKKKIAIIVSVISAVVIVALIVAYAVKKDDNGYVDLPVTEIVTDENGEPVTDENGNVVTRAVTDASGNTVTEKADGNTSYGDTNGAANNSNAGGNNVSTSKIDSDNNATVRSNDKTTTKKEATTKPKARKISVTVKFPQGQTTDTVLIYADDQLVSEEEVTVGKDGLYTFETEDKYKGDVKITASLKNYKSSASFTVLASSSSVRLDMPLNHVEEVVGEDD